MGHVLSFSSTYFYFFSLRYTAGNSLPEYIFVWYRRVNISDYPLGKCGDRKRSSIVKIKLFLFLVLTFAVVGSVFAGDFGYTLSERHFSSADTSESFDLYAEGGKKAPKGGTAVIAGFMNMPLGIWSWMHEDWLGGSITAGLLIGGIIVYIIPIIRDDEDFPIGNFLIGTAMIFASPIYGFFRGKSQYTKLKAQSLAKETSNNPMDNISLVVFPTFDENNLAGRLSYSFSY